MRITALFIAFLITLAPAFAEAAPYDGTWKAVMTKAKPRCRPLSITLVVNGSTVTGTVSDGKSAPSFVSGTINSIGKLSAIATSKYAITTGGKSVVHSAKIALTGNLAINGAPVTAAFACGPQSSALTKQ